MLIRFLRSTAAIAILATLSSVACRSSETSKTSETWPSRTADGQPDMQGVWANKIPGQGLMSLEPLSYLKTIGLPQRKGPGGPGGNNPRTGPPPNVDALGGLLQDPPDHILPYQPWAKARRDAIMKDSNLPTPAQMDPHTRGWPAGVPRLNYYSSHEGDGGGPIQILQPPGYVVFFYEVQHEFRIVPVDGRPHVGQDIKLWMGDSRGRWEGNTLVVDVTNQNDSTRFNIIGDFHSDAMRMTERWTFVDRDTIDYKATIDDPKVYTRPWTIGGVTHTRGKPGEQLMEYAGVEGESCRSLTTGCDGK